VERIVYKVDVMMAGCLHGEAPQYLVDSYVHLMSYHHSIFAPPAAII